MTTATSTSTARGAATRTEGARMTQMARMAAARARPHGAATHSQLSVSRRPREEARCRRCFRAPPPAGPGGRSVSWYHREEPADQREEGPRTQQRKDMSLVAVEQSAKSYTCSCQPRSGSRSRSRCRHPPHRRLSSRLSCSQAAKPTRTLPARGFGTFQIPERRFSVPLLLPGASPERARGGYESAGV
jgi:hypothetical protein